MNTSSSVQLDQVTTSVRSVADAQDALKCEGAGAHSRHFPSASSSSVSSFSSASKQSARSPPRIRLASKVVLPCNPADSAHFPVPQNNAVAEPTETSSEPPFLVQRTTRQLHSPTQAHYSDDLTEPTPVAPPANALDQLPTAAAVEHSADEPIVLRLHYKVRWSHSSPEQSRTPQHGTPGTRRSQTPEQAHHLCSVPWHIPPNHTATSARHTGAPNHHGI